MKGAQYSARPASVTVLIGVTLTVVIAVSAPPTYGAQPAGNGARSSNPACNILSPEELRTITGYPGYRQPSPGDAPGAGAGGGASCQYQGGLAVDPKGKAVNEKGPLISLVVIDGRDYTNTRPIPRGCKNEAVSGVGDAAFFEVCPSAGAPTRTPVLFVKTGTKDLIVQMDIDPPDTAATTQAKLIAVAKAAVAKIRSGMR